MRVRKINPDWMPSENLGIKVGEIIDMTSVKKLILDGMVEAVDEHDNAISAYELFGVIVKNERAEFEEFLKMKKLQATKKSLEKEAAELKEQLEKNKEKSPAPVVLSYEELVKKAQDKGIWKVNMTKRQLEEALK